MRFRQWVPGIGLILGALVLVVPLTAMAEEPQLDEADDLGSFSTNSEELGSIQQRDISQWNWGVGGSYSEVEEGEGEESLSPYEISNENYFFDSVQVKTDSEDRQGSNTGYGQRDHGRRVPVIGF